MPTDLDVLRRVTSRLIDVAAAINPDDLGRATPCASWNLADLLDHVTGGNRFTIALLDGRSRDQALELARASFGSGHAVVEAVTDSASVQLGAFEECDLDATYDHVAGPLTGTQVASLRIHDMAIHTWDVLQAIDPSKGLDPVYVRWAVADFGAPDALVAHHVARFYPAPTTPHELLLAFGRRRRSRDYYGNNDDV
jgi:uncharacterized protein (TIGR03086 family)